jgi:hypothetical protein
MSSINKDMKKRTVKKVIQESVIDKSIADKNITDKNTTDKCIIYIETTGVPSKIDYNRYPNPADFKQYNNARIIQITYRVFNQKNTDKQINKNLLIKPDGFSISNAEFHGITEQKAETESVDISTVFDEMLEDLTNVKIIASHNVPFVKNILLAECHRYKNAALIDFLGKTEYHCTMDIGRTKFSMTKSPTKEELFKLLFKKKCQVSKIDMYHMIYNALFESTATKPKKIYTADLSDAEESPVDEKSNVLTKSSIGKSNTTQTSNATQTSNFESISSILTGLLQPIINELSDIKKHIIEQDKKINDVYKLIEKFTNPPKHKNDVSSTSVTANDTPVDGDSKNEDEALEHKTYIKVSFGEKDTVKKLGAKWDRSAKKWYIKIDNPNYYDLFDKYGK